MLLNSVLDLDTPAMRLVWKTAVDPVMKREKIRKSREIRSVSVEEICDKLKQVVGVLGTKLDPRTFFKTSMILSGAQRLHSIQTDLLLDDTKKLLNTMKKEGRDMKKFDEMLDCRPSHSKTKGLPSLDTTTSPQTLRRPRNAKVFELDWHTLDCDIDWTSGPPRARMQDITMPDDNVPYSPQYIAEQQDLRAQEGTLEGPTLLDWEVNGFEAEEEKTEEAVPIGTLLTVVPEEEQQLPMLPTETVDEAPVEAATVEEPAAPSVVITDEAPAEVPIEEPAAPTALQPEDLQHSEQSVESQPSEVPSQIQLESLEEGETPHTAFRTRRARPIVDPVSILSRDVIRSQINEYIDTMRTQTSFEDIASPGKFQHARRDFFPTKPLHRGIMSDVLLNLFRPCDGEATFAEPKSPVYRGAEELVRDASHSEVGDPSSVLSIHQDPTESSSRSRTLLEAPSGLFEEAPSQLQPIEELESPMPPPSPREAPSTIKQAEPSPTKKGKRPSAPKLPKETSAIKKPEQEQEMLPAEESQREQEILPAEGLVQEVPPSDEREESSASSLKDSITKKDEITEMILDILEHNPEVLFDDLLSEDSGDREAAVVFSHILSMFKNDLIDLHQETAYGPISVSLPLACQE